MAHHQTKQRTSGMAVLQNTCLSAVVILDAVVLCVIGIMSGQSMWQSTIIK